MKLGEEVNYIPHIILEYLADIHSAVDPDTGHFVCHYKPIGLTSIELSGKTYPALRIGDCITLVADKEAVKKIIEETTPYSINRIPPEGYPNETIPLHEIGSALSLLKESAQIELRKTEDSEEIIIIIIKYREDYALILERCRISEGKGDILQV